jgi:hypothetical protein
MSQPRFLSSVKSLHLAMLDGTARVTFMCTATGTVASPRGLNLGLTWYWYRVLDMSEKRLEMSRLLLGKLSRCVVVM